ncbi:prepilin peptidase [Streptomyces xantholiticus]|uniref:prepilin peptidase n=1 Tax=Streptomyces xantholiticus TaxID=68285 RepID=UPI001673BBB6|nr:A24 family peptidase [Streptomyces xantholiticus]GGW48504.1 prepilin peptidase [Streptomyces xantholiticus]
MEAALVVVAALWGAGAGWLCPRAAYRLSVEPGETWRAACPAGHPYGGWVGGPCCPAPLPARVTAPLVTGLVCAALSVAVGGRPELVVWLVLAPFAVLLALVDVSVRRLPDHLTLPLAAGALTLLGAAAVAPGAAGSWTTALLGGPVLGAAYFVLFLIRPDGMGFGDVKLALALGVVLGWYGWAVLFAGAFAGFLLGSVYGLGLIALRRAGRRSAIPFGPFMMAGAWLGVLLGALAVR